MIADAPQLAHQALLERILTCEARVYRFIASAGFGKTTLAWELARRRLPAAQCDLLGVQSELDAWRRLIDALAKLDRESGERIVEESLTIAQAGPAQRRAYLCSVAAGGSFTGTLLIDNAEALAANPLFQLPLAALLEGRPSCTIVLCSRVDVSVRLAALYAPHELVTLRENDLRFEMADMRRMLSGDTAQAHQALMWSGGWPLAAVRAVHLLRAGKALPRTAADEAWLSSLIVENVEALTPSRREAVMRLAAVRDCSVDEAGDVHAFGIPFLVARPDGSTELHPVARAVLQRQYAEECERAREMVFDQALSRGDHLRVAELALQYGDLERAADALEHIDHSSHEQPPTRYRTVLERLDGDLLLQRPRLWLPCDASFQSDFLEMSEELEPVLHRTWDALPASMQSGCAALVALRKAEYYGEWDGALELLDAFEERIDKSALDNDERLRAALCRCSIASNCGWDFDETAFVREYGDALGRSPILLPEHYYLQATRAFFSADREGVLSAIERYLSAMRACDHPAQLRAALYRSLWLPWEVGAYDVHERLRRALVEILRQPTTPNDLLTRIAWEMIDAAQGVAPVREDTTIAIGCLTNLLVAACSDDFDEAATAMQAALQMTGNPAFRATAVILRVAAFAFDPSYEHLLDSAFDNFRDDACPELRATVAALRAGDARTFLEPLNLRFRAAGERSRSAFYVDVRDARVRRKGIEVSFGDRELELFMLLAASGRAVPAIEAAETLWPQSDDEAAHNALKVCLSRIRARTGCKDVIVTRAGDLAISPDHVQTDLARAQRLIRLADEGSSAAAHSALAILERPLADQYRHWHWRTILTTRLETLRAHGRAV